MGNKFDLNIIINMVTVCNNNRNNRFELPLRKTP